MKNLKIALFGLTLIVGLSACPGRHNDNHDHEHHGATTSDSTMMQMHGQGMEFTSAYVCPMHCEGSGSDKPGTCPKCGMDYVKLEDHMKDGHKH